MIRYEVNLEALLFLLEKEINKGDDMEEWEGGVNEREGDEDESNG